MRMNLSRVIRSLNLNNQEFQVYRSQGEFVEGGWQEITQSPASFAMQGQLHPASERELRQFPEGDRVIGAIAIYTVDPLYVTRTGEFQGTSDQVEWNDELYKVLNTMPWSDYGFYASLAQKVSGV